MSNMHPPRRLDSFFELSSAHILESVENALGRTKRGFRATGSLLALNSLENRVYQIEFEDGFKIVTKFYRPGRWTFEQIEEEHRALKSLAESEVPVVAPLFLGVSKLQMIFAVFPFVRGRLRDELEPSDLRTLGRYLGQIHRLLAVEKSRRHRIDPKTFGWDALDYLLESEFFESDSMAERYEDIVVKILNQIEPLVCSSKFIRVHGDCHLGNTLWNGDRPFFLDFDDLCEAPAVQDIWMIVRGRDESAVRDRAFLLEGYQQMNEFNESELSLIEPLRALRIIHYSAWISRRWRDPSFPLAFPDFGSNRYWNEEISELIKISESF